jgi:hypothetical protein
MSHITDTHSQPIPMPKQSWLLRRGQRYYLNARVPKDLRSLYAHKEFIRKSLGTSDRHEAIGLVRYEAFKLDSEFAAKRREMENSQPPTTVHTISDREAHEMVFRWFIQQEKLSEQWYFENVAKMDEQEIEEVLDNLRTDEVVFSGGSKHYEAADARCDVDAFLKSSGLECPKDSPPYPKLVSLFTKARLENLHRNMARVTRQTVTGREPLLRDVFAHTELPAHTECVFLDNQSITRRLLELIAKVS